MTLKHKKIKPKRSLKTAVKSLSQVMSIQPVGDSEAVISHGQAGAKQLGSEWTAAIWNMQKGEGGFGFEHDFRSLSRMSDMILAQESLLKDRNVQIFREPGYEVVHAASYIRKDGLRDGVMTASRFKSCGDSRRIVCRYPEPIFKTPKVALVTTYSIAGSREKLLVVNLHATLVRRIEGAKEEIIHLLGNLPDHGGPILLAGDFNTFTSGYLRAVSNVLRQVGLSIVPVVNDPRPVSQALDQVFVRGLDVEGIVVDTSIKNSDHFPLIVKLSVQNQYL